MLSHLILNMNVNTKSVKHSKMFETNMAIAITQHFNNQI